MKFNITLEYDPEDYDSLEEQVKEKVAERITSDVLYRFGNNYRTEIDKIASEAKGKIVSAMVNAYSDKIITEDLLAKVEAKVNTKLNEEYIKEFSSKIVKQIESQLSSMVQREVEKSTKQIKDNLKKITTMI